MDKPTIKILMIKGEKGDAYDDSELRAEIEATLANNAYVQFVGDGELELPVHTINDNVTSNASTWSSSKITSEISAFIDDSETSNDSTWSSNKIDGEITDINTALGKLSTFGLVLVNPLSFHVAKEGLEGFTTGNTKIATVTPSDPQHTYFKALDDASLLQIVYIPYTWHYTGVSFTDNADRNDINNINFMFGKIWLGKSGTNYEIFIDWARKSGATFNLLNGIYAYIYPLFPRIVE